MEQEELKLISLAREKKNEAIKYYDSSKNVKFSSFVRLCVKSEFIFFVKKHSSKRHDILTDIIYCRKFTD